MSLNFVEKNFILNGNSTADNTLIFYKRGFELGSGAPEPTWQDIILSGNTALTLVNAKANGLNYLKLFGGCEQESKLASVTLSGGCEQTGTPTPTNPIDIVCNNGTISLSQNLFDKDTATILNFVRNGTTLKYETNNERYGVCLELEVGKTYTWSIDRNQSSLYINMGLSATYPSNGVSCSYVAIGTTDSTYTFTVTAETKYAYWWTTNPNFINSMRVELGSAKSGITINGTTETVEDSLENTATAQNLFGVSSSLADTQEVLTGAITRKVAVKVFDGTENWTYQSTNTRFVLDLGDIDSTIGLRATPMYCTHYNVVDDGTALADIPNFSIYGATTTSIYIHDNRYTQVSDFQSWLASQYLAGNPVILVYPLATATTESATAQTLIKAPVTQTAGSISDLTINTTNQTTPTPSSPLDIVCNNGVLKVDSQGNIYVDGTTETVEIKGKNLWDTNGFSYAGVDYAITKTTYGFTATARSGAGTSARVVVYIPMGYLKANTTYFISGVTGVGNVYIGRTVNDVSDNGYYKNTGSSKKFTITDIAEGQTRFILTMYLGRATEGTVKDFSQIQLEEGTSATDYVIPFNGGTATAENLLKVNETADVQNITTGEITRGIYTLVLTGNEPFTSSKVGTTSRYVCALDERALSDGKSSRGSILSTHFISIHANTQQTLGGAFTYSRVNLYIIPSDQTLDTTEKFIAWLEEQYANDTPVIICYPLETSTTETVTAQTLTTQAGTNIVEITQASIDGLPLEVSYKGGVSVTVTEVENANLSNSVTVTIGE